MLRLNTQLLNTYNTLESMALPEGKAKGLLPLLGIF